MKRYVILNLRISLLLLAGCATNPPSLIEQIKLDTAKKYREACMNSMGENIDPLMRVQILQQCNAWARKKAGF